MDVLFLIGRILFSMILVGSGIGHLMQADSSAEYAAHKGIPSPKPAVLLSGVLMLAAGVAFILGIWMDLAGFGTAALLLIMGFTMHAFWGIKDDPQMQQMEMAHFMKNLSIAGGALVLASQADRGWLQLTDGLF